MTTYDVLIVGAGHGGAQAAIALRQLKFAGTIAIIGDEPHLPYERPPLSKDYLSKDKTFERILIRPEAFWRERSIDFLLGHRVTRVDPSLHVVTMENGETVGYGQMIWATGGQPRRLSCPGHDLPGVHSVRTRQDVDAIMASLGRVKQVGVIGGGYIGLEAAAVLAKLGKRVVLLESLPRVLARVAGEPLSRFFEEEHRARSVEVRLNVTVDRLEELSDGQIGVRLAGGEVFACDMVIVGIGIVAAVAPLVEAGASGTNGVDVDGLCRTSLPDIFAIGDCAAHENTFAEGARIRLESVQNAVDQAMVAARAITGTDTPYHAVPWFWSNQYDLKLQTVGLSTNHDEIVVRGSVASRSFSLIYLKEGRVIALDCVNCAKDYVQGRKLVEQGARISSKLLADASVSLKDAGADLSSAAPSLTNAVS